MSISGMLVAAARPVTRWHEFNAIAFPLQFFVRNPLFSVTVRNSTVTRATAGAVGGGVAVRASNLVESPGARFVDLVNVTITNCTAQRGGGTLVGCGMYDCWQLCGCIFFCHPWKNLIYLCQQACFPRSTPRSLTRLLAATLPPRPVGAPLFSLPPVSPPP